MEIGSKFREIRKSQDKSLRDVERDTGITRGYLSRFERDKIPNASLSRMEELADYYGVDINTIITSDEQEWKEKLPPKLKEFVENNNIDFLKVGLKAKEKGLTPEEVENLIEIISNQFANK
ncbi:MAG: helix-turn-helix domain-containing protein [Clostridia bacterium]